MPQSNHLSTTQYATETQLQRSTVYTLYHSEWPAVLMILPDENWISLPYLSWGKRSKVEERKIILLSLLLKFPVFQIQAGVHPIKISSLNKARAHQKLAKDTDSSGKPFLPPLCYSCHNIP